MKHSAKPRHLVREVDGVRVHLREAGVRSSTGVVLLHGFPASSHSFRDVVPVLGEHAYVVAPDLPGFGFSEALPPDEYTFERLTDVIEALLAALGIERYVLYVTDFGTPVGYSLALRHPRRVLGLVVQNGNAHDAGLGEAWDTARRFWADPSAENKELLPEWLTFEGTRDQYLAGSPPEVQELHPPESWHLDWERLSQPGMTDLQFRLFTDYRTHVARFDEIAEYHRQHQPPCLVLWGRFDTFFDIREILAYHEVMASLEVHVYDAGHFLLETHSAEVAELLAIFVDDVLEREQTAARPRRGPGPEPGRT